MTTSKRDKAKESTFQKSLIREIKQLFPGCIVLKNDAQYFSGIPDLLILYNDKWAALECKRFANAEHQPNQDFWVSRLRRMSYASFVFPENRKEVLYELQLALKT